MNETCLLSWQDLPLPLARQVESICSRFEKEWKAGAPRPIEAYLAEAPEKARKVLSRELVALELTYRNQAGDTPILQDYTRRFGAGIHDISTLFAEIVHEAAAQGPDFDPEQTRSQALGEGVAPDEQPTRPQEPQRFAGMDRRSNAASDQLPTIPGYMVEGILGQGAMGVVYLACQSGFERKVALKMIRSGADASTLDRERFRTEAMAIARQKHPNIINVFGFGEHDGCLFFSMEYVADGSLADKIKAGLPTERHAAELVELLARAMDHAHQQGVVHRDLKPSNIMLEPDGTPKIADFGLARLLDTDGNRTNSRAVAGTASYMAPEQASGNSNNAGPAADIYALGAILFQLLTRQPPFGPGRFPQVLEQVRTQAPPAPRSLCPSVSRVLEAICLKCLQKDPADRYQSAAELATDLRLWLDGKSTKVLPLSWGERARGFVRRRPIASAAALMLLVALPVTNHYLDADRFAKDALKKLERGEPVPLIGDTGLPHWKREVIGVPAVGSHPEDGVCQVSSFGGGYLELLPKLPTKGYRLKAQLRHDSSTFTGEVGLYFLHKTFQTGKGTEHCFLVLNFNDCLPENPAKVALQFIRWSPGAEFPLVSVPRVVETFTPAVVKDGSYQPWRDLEVVVSQTRIEVFWDGTSDGISIKREELVEDFQQINPVAKPQYFETNFTPSFGPEGGLGIYVDHGDVSVRNVTVEPCEGP